VIEVRGLDLVQANLRRVSQGFPREQKRIHTELGQPILQRARNRARVRTGRLRSMIRFRTTQSEVEVTSEADYAKFLHWGTRYISADLHLTEPLHELENVLVRDYQRMTERFIDRNWRSSA
jgi:hypothetical protein